jgi:hypothetical protein
MSRRHRRARPGDLDSVPESGTSIVIAGLVPVISIPVARYCQYDRDGRDKPGHDVENTPSLFR